MSSASSTVGLPARLDRVRDGTSPAGPRVFPPRGRRASSRPGHRARGRTGRARRRRRAGRGPCAEVYTHGQDAFGVGDSRFAASWVRQRCHGAGRIPPIAVGSPALTPVAIMAGHRTRVRSRDPVARQQVQCRFENARLPVDLFALLARLHGVCAHLARVWPKS
jgi:hypothetical protein